MTMPAVSSPQVPLTAYTSKILQIYLEHLGRCPDPQLLDLGPVCKENIAFFAERAKTLSVCDMFSRLARQQEKGLSTALVWNHLDYGSHSFHGIHLWDLLDHIDDHEAKSLAALCHKMLKPNGMLLIISLDEQSVASRINSFVIQDKCGLILRHQAHLNLPWHDRNIRSLTSLLREFSVAKSFLYRNGARELLFSRK